MRFYLPLTRRSRMSVGCLGMTLIVAVYLLWVPIMALIWLTINLMLLTVRLIAKLATQSGEAYRAHQGRKTRQPT